MIVNPTRLALATLVILLSCPHPSLAERLVLAAADA